MSQQAVANKENANTAQIQNLLGTISTLVGALYRGEDEQGGARDGGTKTALEVTLINVCSRLDSVLSDSKRWTVDEYDSLKNMYEENTKYIQAQRALAEEARSPHNRYKPSLVRLANGKWMAYAGNPNDLDNALVGVGDCPEKAVEAFDELFKGKVTDDLAKILEQHNENTKQTLDSGGTGNPADTQKPKRRRRGDSNPDGAQPSVGDE